MKLVAAMGLPMGARAYEVTLIVVMYSFFGDYAYSGRYWMGWEFQKQE